MMLSMPRKKMEMHNVNIVNVKPVIKERNGKEIFVLIKVKVKIIYDDILKNEEENKCIKSSMLK